MDPQPPSTPSPDLLGDLLGPLAIEGPPDTAPESDPRVASGLEGGSDLDALALAPVEDQSNTVQVPFFFLCVVRMLVSYCICILGILACHLV